MNVTGAVFLIFFIVLSDGAAINKQNDTLNVLKHDIAQVGGAIEDFTFDVIRNLLDKPQDVVEDSEDVETTTTGEDTVRKIRSINDDDFVQLCQKRCQEDFIKDQKIETQHIKELKDEVKKLKELITLLHEQHKIIKTLHTVSTTTPKVSIQNTTQPSETIMSVSTNETSRTTQINEPPEDNVPNSEQLELIKEEISEAIKSLNQTKELMSLQKQKDVILEKELKLQQDDIKKLKLIVNTFVNKNSTIGNKSVGNVSARSSDFSDVDIRKLLKKIPDDDDDDDDQDLDDLTSKISLLQKQLKKKKRQQNLEKELKMLREENSPDDVLKQLIKTLRRMEPERKSVDSEINNLDDLQAAINNLRPKENNDAAQFQAMLTKLINRPASNLNQRPSPITITPQQMNEFTKKFTPNNYPYICILDDGGVKNNGYNRVPVNSRNFQFNAPPSADYSNQKTQFFPGANYNPQSNFNPAGSDKPYGNQQGNGEYNQKYQQDLKNQIDGLQAAIDNLNRPEYTQKPEDKAVIDDLEHQIGDLRGIVDNLNYSDRTKRSLDNNEIEDKNEITDQMKDLVGKILDEDKKEPSLQEIQKRIDEIKNHLGSGNNSSRSSTQDSLNPNFADLYNEIAYPTNTAMKSSGKSDFFTEIISKILDKVIAAIPVVFQKLFNFSFEQLAKNDYQDYDIQVLFKNLGIFAYLPVIAVRLLRGVSAFLSLLRKNKFFKNFLMPAVLLATVAGSVLFLIWWLQPDNDYYETQYQSNYAPPADNANYDQSKTPVSYNYPVYNRSYFNK